MRNCALLATATVVLVLSGCGTDDDAWPEADIVGHGRTLPPAPTSSQPATPGSDSEGLSELPRLDLAAYATTATEWGPQITGVRTRLATDEAVVALTLDACASPGGTEYDADLIDYLRAEEIPATLFVTQRWIDANEDIAVQLADTELFEIANHGATCRPLSVTGQSAYEITGTTSPAEIAEEILGGQEAVEALTGEAPVLFRSGTAHYDEVAVQIVQDMDLLPVGFDVLGDGGATYTAEQVVAALDSVEPGSIVLLHMNRPAGGTAEGVQRAIPTLRDRGFRFVRLSDYPLE